MRIYNIRQAARGANPQNVTHEITDAKKIELHLNAFNHCTLGTQIMSKDLGPSTKTLHTW